MSEGESEIANRFINAVAASDPLGDDLLEAGATDDGQGGYRLWGGVKRGSMLVLPPSFEGHPVQQLPADDLFIIL